MSKKLSFIILGSILLLAQGCIFFPAVKGDGNVTTHTIDISDYDQISVDASAAVFNYTQEESAPALTVTVDQNIYDLFDFKTDDNIVVIDPDMGDYGNLYPTYTDETCQEMKKLVKYADILTPNLTEACIITDEPYRPDYSNDELKKIAMKLVAMGPSKIVITGIQRGHYIGNYCYEKNREDYLIKTMKVGTQRSGTGDIFASIIAADAVNGVNFHESVRKASTFIKKCILKAIEMDIPLTDGVLFEELLTTLK